MKGVQLIFVYNAEGSLFGRLTDFAHKIVSPSTYGCKLCFLTYGNFAMKEQWMGFITSLPVECLFLYHDEFVEKYAVRTNPPAVYVAAHGRIKQLISGSEINDCDSLEQLEELVSEKLKNLHLY